jgi:hypothetical protein
MLEMRKEAKSWKTPPRSSIETGFEPNVNTGSTATLMPWLIPQIRYPMKIAGFSLACRDEANSFAPTIAPSVEPSTSWRMLRRQALATQTGLGPFDANIENMDRVAVSAQTQPPGAQWCRYLNTASHRFQTR